MSFKTLVLNADYKPLSYFPLSVCNWKESIKAVYLDKVSVISEYNEIVRSPSIKIKIPSVIALKEYVICSRKPAFTRFNVFLRDGFECQYCGAENNLTFDHILPKSRGGKTTWENVITACSDCNTSKGNKTLKELKLSIDKEPFEPSISNLQEKIKKYPPNYLHDSWKDYLYWDTELQP
tara:strand:+ start:678 stop:1214 length:537 start_codon:yes stop_codon:yes gene_type:complete